MRQTFFLLFIVFVFSGCKTKTAAIKNGNDAVNRKLYSVATNMLIKEFEAENNPLKKQEKAIAIGNAFMKYNEPVKASVWYKKASVESGSLIGDAFYKLGQTLKMQELYDSAVATFTMSNKLGSSFNVRKELKSSREALKWQNDFSRIKVQNLESVNTQFSDFAPALYGKDKLVFTSSKNDAEGDDRNGWTGEKFGDLYTLNRSANGVSGKVTSFSRELNTSAYEGTCAFTADGNSVFFTRCFSNETASQFCHIYLSTFDGTIWSEAQKLDLFPDTFNVGQPAISKSGKILVVSSDFEGFGGKDIFYFSKNDTGWSRPSNASGTINTTGDEMFPWLDEKDNLYFSSSGFSGMGGLDIFKAIRTKNAWRNAENLRAPINSGGDDFSYVIEKYKPINDADTVLMTGYFSSSRKGGKGSDDIYRFEELWLNQYEVRGKIITKQFENPEDPNSKVLGLVPLRLSKVDLQNYKGDSLASFVTDTGGLFFFTLQQNSNYNLFASRNDYFSNAAKVSTIGKKNRDSVLISQYVEIELEKIFTSKEIEIPNIYYDYDKATLRPESKVVLDSLVLFFTQNKAIDIEIGSHTDSRGSDEYNLKLSQARAQSVVDYLIEKGISKDRLIARGFGETRPVNGCVNNIKCTEEEHQKNRRTTFRVTGTKFLLQSIEPTQIRVDPKPDEGEDEE